MFALVILLTEPRTKCIVPERFICGLEELEDQLKTWGVSKKKHLIFWTRSIDNDDYNIASIATVMPDFNLEQRLQYPPPTGIDSACYLGHVKRFFKTFEAAKEFRDKFRATLPVVYNEVQANKQPIPPLSLLEANEEKFSLPAVTMDQIDTDAIEQILNDEFEDDDAENIHNVPIDDVLHDQYEGNFKDILQNDNGLVDCVNDHELVTSGTNNDNVSVNETHQHNSLENSKFESTENNNAGGIENIKNPADSEEIVPQNQSESVVPDGEHIPAAVVEPLVRPLESEETSIGIATASMQNSSLVEDDANAQMLNASTFLVTNNGKIQVTDILAGGLEMTYILGEKLVPLFDKRYQVKQNDILSGNRPFQENEQQDRAYLVKIDGEFQEVKLNGRIVKWLLGLNKNRSNDQAIDRPFIKALLISIFTVKTIKEGVILQPELMSFLKDLFVVRAGDEKAARVQSFDELVSVALDEIRKLK